MPELTPEPDSTGGENRKKNKNKLFISFGFYIVFNE
jgi:hypothetical protein